LKLRYPHLKSVANADIRRSLCFNFFLRQIVVKPFSFVTDVRLEYAIVFAPVIFFQQRVMFVRPEPINTVEYFRVLARCIGFSNFLPRAIFQAFLPSQRRERKFFQQRMIFLKFSFTVVCKVNFTIVE
jgi:hypothetical protein